MQGKNQRKNYRGKQRNVGFKAPLHGSANAQAMTQRGVQAGHEISKEPHAEKPDAVSQQAFNPVTGNPDAAETRAGIEPIPELVLVYMPGHGRAMLTRGGQSMAISTKEMLGLIAPSSSK